MPLTWQRAVLSPANSRWNFSEGGILWNGIRYRELTFHPQSADASFSLHDVTIGVNFHWERRGDTTFLGTLRLVVDSDKVCAAKRTAGKGRIWRV